MRLYHNLASLSLYRNYKKNLTSESTAMARISSGVKINSAKDGANKIGQSELIRIQIRGGEAARRNVQDGVSMMQAVDGALNSVGDALNRMKELTVQANNGTLNSQDKVVVQQEIDQLKQHINEVGSTTEFNGIKLLDSQYVTDNNSPFMQSMTSGANSGDKIDIPMYKVNTTMLKDSNNNLLSDVDVTDATKYDTNISVIDDSLRQVLSMRSKYGALQNRLETTVDSLDKSDEVLQKADGSLRDANLAEEMMNYSKSQILVQSTSALMAQSNRFPQDVLRILDRIR